MGKTFEFTLDKIIYNKNDFIIARVYSKSPEVQQYLNPLYRNVSIKGKMVSLRGGILYNGTIDNIEENQYGYTLSVSSVYAPHFQSDNINTDRQMCSFISCFIGEGTAEKLRGTKGICKIIKEENIKELVKIKGIGEVTAKKIIEIYKKDAVGSKYMVELKELGLTENEINKLKKLYNDDLALAQQNILKNIFEVNCIRLDRADTIFLEKLNGDPKDKRRIRAYIFKALRDYMMEGYKSYIALPQFYNLDIIQNIESNVGRDTLQRCIKDLISNKKLKLIYEKYITTQNEWDLEMNVKQIIEHIIKNQNIYKLPIEDIEKEINEQEQVIGFKLNEGQRKAVKEIIMSDSALNMLNGYAGTGKTSVTKVILNIYNKYGKDKFKLCALSGRASSILGTSSGYPQCASTIHRTLEFDPNGGWKYTFEDKFKNIDVLVIDEISMLDYGLLYSILAPTTPNMKVILLGDSGQLPSLSFGKTIETLRLFKGVQINELTQIMRQSEGAYISKVANEMRMNINPFENTKYRWYGEDTEVCIGACYKYMLDTFIKKYKEDRDSTIIVTTTKAKTDKVNFDIQMMLLKEGLIDESSSYITKPSSTAGKFYKMYIGDNVMILTNNYNAKNFTDKTYEDLEEFIFEEDKRKSKLENSPIFNGEIYTIKDIIGDYVILSNKDGDVLIDDLSLECSLAYCSNCHKLQGSTMANALIYHTSDYTDRHIMCSSQWLYTGYTRAKKYLGIFTDEYKNLSIGARTNAIDEKVTILELIMK